MPLLFLKKKLLAKTILDLSSSVKLYFLAPPEILIDKRLMI
jgi:hypothetical protein